MSKNLGITKTFIFIEITSDQFPDSNEAILMNCSPPWHDKWKIVADYPIHEIQTKDRENNKAKLNPSQAYEAITKNLVKLT